MILTENKEEKIEEQIKRCSNCGEIIISETWFECHDNYLQYKYFDTETENTFCSQECFCRYMSLEEMEEEEEWKIEKNS